MKNKIIVLLLFVFVPALAQKSGSEVSLDSVVITFHASKKVKFPRSTRECTWISIRQGYEVVSVLYPSDILKEKKCYPFPLRFLI